MAYVAFRSTTIAHVNLFLDISVSTSLIAWLITMPGEHWLDSYACVDTDGSIVDRGQRQQAKINKLTIWHFDSVMKVPMFLVDISSLLFLIGCAIPTSVLDDHASVTVIIAAAGLFFLPISFITVYSQRLPSQVSCWLSKLSWKRFRNFLGGSHVPDKEHGGQTILPTADQPLLPLSQDSHVSGSDSISWMITKVADMEVIAGFAIEVIWHVNIQTIPLERLYDTILGCLDYSSGHPIITPELRNKAYVSAMAFLHVAIQRGCVSNGSDAAIIKSISDKHLIMGSKHYEGDSDLEATLGIIDQILAKSKPSMNWKTFSFTATHHVQIGHILLYHAWFTLKKKQPLPKYIWEFICHSLGLVSPPPAPIVADCMLTIGMALQVDVNLTIDDLSVMNKR